MLIAFLLRFGDACPRKVQSSSLDESNGPEPFSFFFVRIRMVSSRVGRHTISMLDLTFTHIHQLSSGLLVGALQSRCFPGPFAPSSRFHFVQRMALFSICVCHNGLSNDNVQSARHHHILRIEGWSCLGLFKSNWSLFQIDFYYFAFIFYFTLSCRPAAALARICAELFVNLGLALWANQGDRRLTSGSLRPPQNSQLFRRHDAGTNSD